MPDTTENQGQSWPREAACRVCGERSCVGCELEDVEARPEPPPLPPAWPPSREDISTAVVVSMMVFSLLILLPFAAA